MKEYWQKNLQILAMLLSVWFISSFGLGILFTDELNSIRMGGFKSGFWFAQQGSIFVFVTLIFGLRTGGSVLLVLLLAPYLREFGKFTVDTIVLRKEAKIF